MNDLFGNTMPPPSLLAQALAPGWLVLEIEQRARMVKRCLPELCMEHSGGESATPHGMTRADALELKRTLGLMMAIDAGKRNRRGTDAARPV